MEIGGVDIIVSVDPKKSVWRVAAEVVKSFWPDAICEDHDDGGEPKYGDAVNGGRILGFFIHENQEHMDSWDKNGLTDQNKNSMIYGLHTDGESEMTFVFGERNKQCEEMVEALKKALQ